MHPPYTTGSAGEHIMKMKINIVEKERLKDKGSEGRPETRVSRPKTTRTRNELKKANVGLKL